MTYLVNFDEPSAQTELVSATSAIEAACKMAAKNDRPGVYVVVISDKTIRVGVQREHRWVGSEL
jgi:hypothetical protein